MRYPRNAVLNCSLMRILFYSDEDEAAKLLIDVGANVNSKNLKGATPLVIAAVKGHYSVLRLLVNHPSIQLHEQVRYRFGCIVYPNHYLHACFRLHG